MEAVVISLAQVIDKIPCPLAAVAPRRIKPGIEAQHLTGKNLQQGTVRLQRFKFSFILDARQVQAVNLSVLDQKRFVRRPEHRIPAQPPEVPAGMVLRDRVMYGKSSARQAATHQSQ